MAQKNWKAEIIDESTFKIPLNLDFYALIDKDDLEKVSNYCWHAGLDGKYASSGIKRVNGKVLPPIKMHRLIMGFPEKGIDHINGNTLDNRKKNLRLCNQSENLRNRSKPINNSSGYKGVSFDKKRGMFRADIRHMYKRHFLGHFHTAQEASNAYVSFAKKVQGEFFHSIHP